MQIGFLFQEPYMKWAPNSIYVLEWEQELRNMFLGKKREKKVTRIKVTRGLTGG